MRSMVEARFASYCSIGTWPLSMFTRPTSLWETKLARIDDINFSETTNTCHDNLPSERS
jgi:hypothetical protein